MTVVPPRDVYLALPSDHPGDAVGREQVHWFASPLLAASEAKRLGLNLWRLAEVAPDTYRFEHVADYRQAEPADSNPFLLHLVQ